MRTMRRWVWAMPLAIAGCSNNNIAVTSTVTNTTEGWATGWWPGETDSSGSASDSADTIEPETSGTDTETTDAETTDAETTGTSGDDASTGTTDASTSTGEDASTSAGEAPPVCGDGVKSGAEECDDGDNFVGDGCDAQCVAEPIRFAVVVAQTPSASDFRVYNVLNGWSETLVSKQAQLGGTKVGMAVSNQHVYTLTKATNSLHRYNLYTGEWQSYAPGPDAEENTAGWMQWVGNGVCLGYWTEFETHCYDGESWRKIPLTISPGLGVTWDPAENELYIKPYLQLGFQVVDLDTDEIVRTVLDNPQTAEGGVTAYWQGAVYMADGASVLRFDAHTGAKLNTAFPLASRKSGDFHPVTGKLTALASTGANTSALIDYDPTTATFVTLPVTLGIGNTSNYFLRYQRSAKE